jgi:hypothetical protein
MILGSTLTKLCETIVQAFPKSGYSRIKGCLRELRQPLQPQGSPTENTGDRRQLLQNFLSNRWTNFRPLEFSLSETGSRRIRVYGSFAQELENESIHS